MFTLHDIIIIWGVFRQEIWRESFSGVIVYVPFMFYFLSGVIPYAPSHFPPVWLPVSPPCFVSYWLSHLINIFFTVLSGNYKVLTAAPDGSIFGAWQNPKTQLKITLWNRFLNRELCERWQNTINVARNTRENCTQKVVNGTNVPILNVFTSNFTLLSAL